jgi:hypothetical protein
LGNYGNNQNITVTFYSGTPNLPIVLAFSVFSSMPVVGDNLFIYDGPTTASPQFPSSPLTSGDPFTYVGTSGYITFRFTSDAILTSSGWEAIIFCATETTTTACTGSFMDPGGAGNYTISNASVTHICSNNGGNAQVAFSAFSLENNFDYLYVYNGPSVTSPQISGSPFTGTTSPGTVTGSGSCLTFLFVSDITTVAAGWNSTISCTPACNISSVTAIPVCAGNGIYNVSGTVSFANPPTSGTLTVTDGIFSQNISGPFGSSANYTLTGLPHNSGSRTVTATFSSYNTCTGSAMYTAPTGCAGADYPLSATNNGTTINTCAGVFADDGDLVGNYTDGQNRTVTLCSTTGSNDQVTVTFLNFSTEAGNDLLYIYDGPNTSAPQVAGSPFSGTGAANSPGVVTSSGGCLSFRFVSNGSVNSYGWRANVSCGGMVPGSVPPAPSWNGYGGTACSPADNTKISGTVFEDFDNDGVKDALEPFIKGVSVAIFDENAQVGAPVLTDANGLYTFTGLVSTKVYRVEFTIPAIYEEGAYGTGSGTSVQFVKPGVCNANLGLLDKGHYCGLTNPKWTIPVYANGSPSHPSNSGSFGVARFDYTASGQSPNASQENWVTFGTIGTTWGTAYRRDDATLYMASVLRRHTGLGPGGVGAIYKRADAGTNTSATVFYDFGAVAGSVANNATRFPGSGTTFGSVGACGLCDNLDPSVFGQIGKAGLGDIDLSSDESTMYVTNLFDRKVYSINMSSPTPGSAVALPGQPWLSGSPCTNGTARPWALKYRQGKLYVGVICDGGSSTCSKTGPCNDLTATVYAFDGSAWTTVISYPLNYYRKAYALGSNYWVRWMDNWSDFTANYANVTDAQFAQPVMVDIEFDDDGSMIMGFGDRTAMQTGYQAPPPPGPTSSTAERTFAHGDMLRAAFNPGTGAFTLENNGVAGSRISTNPASNVGPGGKAFYWGDHWYGASNDANIGALGILPGSGQVMHPVADPIDPYASGVVWSSNTNGAPVRKLEVYQGSPQGNSPNFAKNGGLGDIELLCANPPVEIGNYVWWDHDLNGRMDPDEPGIPNVTLRLYLDPDGNTQGNNPASGDEILVATTTTDSRGRYIFSFSGASNGLNAQTWQPGHTRVQPKAKYQIRINNFASDAGLTAYATGIGSPAFILSPTQNQGGAGGNRDNNAYDNPGNAASAVLVGAAGENDHSFDFAFGPAAGCALVAQPTANTPCVGATLSLSGSQSGGIAPYTYSWAGPGGFTSAAQNPSIANVTAAAAGTYTLTVTDNGGCTNSMTIAVALNSVVIASAVPTAASCGSANGSIALTISGGITPYTFDWSGAAPDVEDPTGLAAGNYTVTVTDNYGCSATAVASVGSTGGPTVTPVPTHTTCNLPNGGVTLVVVGGASPYDFDWAHIPGAGNIQDLPAGTLAPGTYNVTVTDNLGCLGLASVAINPSAAPSVAVTTATNTTCGLNNGTIDVTASGTSGYMYDWAHIGGASNSEDLTGLAPGTYTVVVTDAGGCQTSTQATITPSTGPMALATPVNALCGLPNGSINLTISGGAAPVVFDWNYDGIGDNNDPEDPTGLGAGTYAVTATDALGCTVTTTATVGDSPPITLSTTTTNASSCLANNGTVNLTVTGGNVPFVFDWNNDGHAPPDYDTEDLNNLAPGTYVVTVTDEDGCTATTSISIGLSSGATVTATVTDPANCTQTGSVDLEVTGGASPYTYNWSNLPGASDPQDQSGLAAGTYQVTVTEANTCTTVQSISIRDIREPVLSVQVTQPACGMSDGAIDLTIIPGDGAAPFTIAWTNLVPASNEDHSGVGPGNYTVTVTDNLQCSATLVVSVSSSAAPTLTLVPTNGTCSANNGAIDLSISGGMPNYTIDWDNLAGTTDPEDQNSLGAGTYAVTVTDMVGCTAAGSVGLSVVAAPTATCTGTDETDPGNNGAITLEAAEIGPFSYDWNVNALDGTQNPTGLAAGTYTVTVEDALGCQTNCVTTIAFRAACAISGVTFANQGACNNNGTGSNSADDYFTANVTVTFMDAPSTGNLVLSGDVLSGGGPLSVAVGSLASPTSHTFSGVRLRANGAATSVTATFSDGTNCTLNVSGPSSSCPMPSIADPCTCHDIIYDATNDPLELLDYAEITDAPGKTWQIISHTGLEVIDPLVSTPFPVPQTLTYDAVTGKYRINYAHTNGIGYTATFSDGTNTLSISNLCNKNEPERLTFESSYCSNAQPFALPPSVPNFTATYHLGTLAGPQITVFDPAQYNGNVVIIGRYTPISSVDCPMSIEYRTAVVPAPTLATINASVCNNNTIDLSTLVTNNGGGSLRYFNTQADAIALVNDLPSPIVTVTAARHFYVRSQVTQNGQTCQSTGANEVTVSIRPSSCGTILVTGPN